MQGAPEPQFILNGSTMLGIGTILGALNGAIVWLTRQLLASKEAEIKRLEHQVELLSTDRDFLRDLTKRYVDRSLRGGPEDITRYG